MKFRFTGDKRDALPAASPPEPSVTLTKFMDLPVEIHHRIVAEVSRLVYYNHGA